MSNRLTLVCDCPIQAVCEGDLLAGMVFDAGRPAVGHHASVGLEIPWREPSSPCSLHVRFPLIEDLINSPPFSSFPQWCAHSELEWDGALNPQLVTGQERHWQRTAEGSRRGYVPSSVHAPHQLAHYPTPFKVRFEAEITAQGRGGCASRGGHLWGPSKSSSAAGQAWIPALELVSLNPFRRVTAKRDVGFVGLMVLLMSWGDTALPRNFLLGMPAVGTALAWRFPPSSKPETTRAEILADAQRDNARILQALRPGKDDAFLLSQSQKDAEAGFCTPPLKHADLLRRLRGRPSLPPDPALCDYAE